MMSIKNIGYDDFPSILLVTSAISPPPTKTIIIKHKIHHNIFKQASILSTHRNNNINISTLDALKHLVIDYEKTKPYARDSKEIQIRKDEMEKPQSRIVEMKLEYLCQPSTGLQQHLKSAATWTAMNSRD